MTSTALVSLPSDEPNPVAVPAILDPTGLGSLPRVPLIPQEIRRRHHVFVPTDHRFKAAARFLQAIWREDRGLPIGQHVDSHDKRVRLGSRINVVSGELGANFLHRGLLPVVARALAYRELGALYDVERLKTNLLSSQTLVFNVFGLLQLDLQRATRFMAELFPGLLREVTEIAFEHSPGRGEICFTGDGTAFDVAVRGRSETGKRVFVAIEVKYSEGCHEPLAQMTPRYPKIARKSQLFRDPQAAALVRNPFQQLFRQHCLISTILERDMADQAVLAFIAPEHNHLAQGAAAAYRDHLQHAADGPIPFANLSLEKVILAIAASGREEHARALHQRYTDWWLVDGELQLDDLPEAVNSTVTTRAANLRDRNPT